MMATTERPVRVEINCTTGEETIIELTDVEIAQIEKDYEEQTILRNKLDEEAQAKAEAKASAIAKLTALGLTEEEAQSLINR